MRKCFVLFAILAVIGYAFPSYAGFDSMTLFDDFNKNKGAINALKWVGQENESDTDNRVIREGVRQIKGQQLHLGVCARGTCVSCGDTGSKWGMTRLKTRDLVGVTALKTTVKVNKVTLVGGTANTAPAIARARLLGYFFNDGTSTGAGDATGDVYAYICLGKASNSATAPNKVDIQGYVFRCKDAACNSQDTVGSTPVSLGTVPIGQPVTLYVEWDQTNHKFIFQKIKGQTLRKTQEISYSLTDTAAPADNNNNYRVDVIGMVPNDSTATTLGTIPTAAMDASFDDVCFSY